METEVLVIGAGPVGAAAAWRLRFLGVGVICAEQGDWLTSQQQQSNAPHSPSTAGREQNVNPNIRAAPADIPIDDGDSPIKPAIGNNVGGGTAYWAAHAPRFRPDDFEVFDTDDVASNWPVQYDELAPWYSLNESMTGVAYVNGDPTLPPRMDSAFLFPQMTPAAEWMSGILKQRMWHVWQTDIVVGREEIRRRHDFRDFNRSIRRASGADTNYIPAAVANGARLLTGTRILELEHDSSNRITSAIAERNQHRFRIRADNYVLAANGLGTPHLLLISQSGKHPNGLANGSGLVGRRLMLHPYAWVDAIFPEPFADPADDQQASIISLALRDSQPNNGHVRGARLQFAPRPSSSSASTTLASASSDSLPARKRLDRNIIGFSICAEDLPEIENRIELSASLQDSSGRPAPKIVYRLSENSHAILDNTMESVEALFRDIGALSTHRTPLKEQAGFHIMGTATMGDSEENSVTNRWGKSHEIDNLFVADASVFVTSSVMNPTATAQAFALRQADWIVMGAKTGALNG